ncbi:alpha-1,2-mannosyltransferase ktr1 [Mycoemilia scoparia]|uniref:Alpha-1,2-mannosyltransferase ktr1 n=1 Tax=Mycoemilia scoparia TaxID=417184 RepID=A0A9W7ZPF6_9FUNG|nr:alpha-1,2-mannosyltransferase ktr1 [Mycoemilia scoparia]
MNQAPLNENDTHANNKNEAAVGHNLQAQKDQQQQQQHAGRTTVTEIITIKEQVPQIREPDVPHPNNQDPRKDPPTSKSNHTVERVNGAFVILARNSDLDSLRPTILELEARFNHRYHYPYVFLNEKPFDTAFKRGIEEVAPDSEIEYGLIPNEHWSYPPWIDQEKARQQRQIMKQKKVIYGDSEPYRHMCRFNSGFFYRHPLLAKYKWYWRVEPSVKFPCEIDYDPFRFMQENRKLYGFTVSIKEFVETIPTLWNTTVKFMEQHKDLMPKNNLLHFVEEKDSKNPGGKSIYNRCHFWSNFEIGSLDFMRGREYNMYFDYLDKAGGFFYERWGDAPVHSLGVAMFMNKDQVHWFKDIGYFHNPLWNCPQGDDHKRLKCTCDPKLSIDIKNKQWSCSLEFKDLPFSPIKS